MSRSAGQSIADSLQLALGYAERLLTDIPADKFARFANVGGTTIESNHPAFILGHLSLYAPRILSDLGAEPVAVPDSFAAAFSKDATCQDDPDGTIYPPMPEVTETFFNGYRRALEVLQAASDDTLQQPNPAGGRLTELFPTIGSMHAFYVGGHVMMHLGQLSAWRRMNGLGAA